MQIAMIFPEVKFTVIFRAVIGLIMLVAENRSIEKRDPQTMWR
jgi:hypothetical protein